MISGMRVAPELRHRRTAQLNRSRRVRRLLAGGVALLVAVSVVACSGTLVGTPVRADPVTAASGDQQTPATPSGQITEPGAPGSTAATSASGAGTNAAAGLARFYTQTLSWGPCAPFAVTSGDKAPYANPKVQCARLTVPLDYAKPDGETITLGVLRQRATGSAVGSVVFNPGGPGASGMSIVATLAQYGVDPTLSARFDFVGFDPRGVGASEPTIACQTDKQRDAQRAENWPGYMASSTAAEVAAANDVSKAVVADCLATIAKEGVDSKAFLARVGTVDVAKDLDVLRAVLGDSKLTYVGWSYGTSIGTAYAEQFPRNVRAMILDGAVDPAEDSAAASLDQTVAFQRAFNDFAAWCAPRKNCPWTSASDANLRFQDLAQPLMDTPLKLADGRVLSFSDAVSGAADALYSDLMWPQLLDALNNLVHGSGDALMALADDYYERDSSGHYSNLIEAFTAIRCMDSDRITDPEKVIKLNQELINASPFQDNGQPAAAVFDVCAYWPVPPTMLPHTPHPAGLAQVLVISTTGDPATPYQSGVNLAKDLGGRLLTVKGTRHTAYMLQGLTCVDKAGDAYLINLTLPAGGATCSS